MIKYPREHQDSDCSNLLFVLLLQQFKPRSDCGLYLALCTVLCIKYCFVQPGGLNSLGAFSNSQTNRASFMLLCSDLKFTLLDEVSAPFIIFLLQINCLLQNCVYLFAQPISDCYLSLWNMRMLSLTAVLSRRRRCGAEVKFCKSAFIVLAQRTNVTSTNVAKKHKPA